jgi:hypothetical protein
VTRRALVECSCAKCGRRGKTRRPRPDFLCVRCFIEKDLGRPLNADDIKITHKEAKCTP